MLKQMEDTMDVDVADATAKDEEAMKVFESVSKVRAKEIQALTDGMARPQLSL